MLHDVCAIISMYITKHLSILYQTTVSMTGPACHQEPSSVVKQSAYRGHLATSKRPGGCCFGGREGCIGVYMQQTNLCIYIYISTYIYFFFWTYEICMKTCISNHESQYISKKTNMCFILIHSFQYIFLNLQVIFKFHIQDVHQNS